MRVSVQQQSPFDIPVERDAEIDRQVAEYRRYGELEWRPPSDCEKCERCGTVIMVTTLQGVRGLMEYVGHNSVRESFFRPHGPRRCDQARTALHR